MTNISRVLIVDDDLALQHLLKVKLQKFNNSFEITFAENGEQALDLIGRDKFQLLVTDIKMPRMDGLALLSHVASNYPSLPCIVLTSYTIPGLEEKLSPTVLKFHRKPVNPEELGNSIVLGLEHVATQGSLGGVSLTGFAQIIEAEMKTCELIVSRQAKEIGRLFFSQGELIHATAGDDEGEKAATRLLGQEKIQTGYNPGLHEAAPERTIHAGLQGLILEAMRLKDEQSLSDQEKNDPVDRKLLEQGIRLCEGLHFTQAQKPLSQFLQKNETSIDAWLWLSRCMGSKKKTKIILQKLYHLDPLNKIIAGEIRKFHAAARLCGERIVRCPFCYTPLNAKAMQCPFCRAHVVITDDTLQQIGKNINRQQLLDAVQRFEGVLSREFNIPALFYAGMAHLNLGDFDEALQYVEQVQECMGSSENIYSKTIPRILSYIASHQGTRDQKTESNESSVPLPTDDKMSSKKKVLVVEDSPTTRKIIKMTLETNNYRVVEAADGVEALTKLNDEHPDLVLLDVMLPTLDGYGILTLLKKNKHLKKVPVIMLTSKDRFRDKIKGRFSAASAYLTKPFKPDILLKEVEKYLPSG